MKHKILWVDNSDVCLEEFRPYFNDYNFKFISKDSISHTLKSFCPADYPIIVLKENFLKSLGGVQFIINNKTLNKTNLIIFIDIWDMERLDSYNYPKNISFIHESISKSNLLILIKSILFHKNSIRENFENSFCKKFKRLQKKISLARDFSQFSSVYSELVSYEIDLHRNTHEEQANLLKNLFDEANISFFRFIKDNYENWLQTPLSPDLCLSPEILKKFFLPKLRDKQPHLLLILDNMRLDQFTLIDLEIKKYFQRTEFKICCSLLPTTTQYSRNALFSGLFPNEIAKVYPELWVSEQNIQSKNNNEKQLLEYFLTNNNISKRLEFLKSFRTEDLKRFLRLFSTKSNNIFVLVCNNLDQLSHLEQREPIIQSINSSKEMYREYSALWFKNSSLMKLIKRASQMGFNLTLGTDHGSQRVNKSIKIKSNRTISRNLRYKIGQSMSISSKYVMRIEELKNIRLPQTKINESVLFAGPALYFTYPNNRKNISERFCGSLQHGGISLEEMCIPWANYIPKK